MAMSTSQRLSAEEDRRLMDKAVHTKHKDYGKLFDQATLQQQHLKTAKKRIIVPVEEDIKVPVYKKVANRGTKKVVVQGTKLVPVTKYKEVEETVLQVQHEHENGHQEKRAVPVTRVRRIPYQEFEEKVVDVEVEVPADEVVTRKGFRVDKHVVSKVVEVEEDLVYEMRPVLVHKGDKRMKDIGEHHTFKKQHGAPLWEDSVGEGWRMRPPTPAHRSDLPRPSSAASIRSVASSIYVPPLKATKYIDSGVIKSPSYMPRSNFKSKSGSRSLPSLTEGAMTALPNSYQ